MPSTAMEQTFAQALHERDEASALISAAQRQVWETRRSQHAQIASDLDAVLSDPMISETSLEHTAQPLEGGGLDQASMQEIAAPILDELLLVDERRRTNHLADQLTSLMAELAQKHAQLARGEDPHLLQQQIEHLEHTIFVVDALINAPEAVEAHLRILEQQARNLLTREIWQMVVDYAVAEEPIPYSSPVQCWALARELAAFLPQYDRDVLFLSGLMANPELQQVLAERSGIPQAIINERAHSFEIEKFYPDGFRLAFGQALADLLARTRTTGHDSSLLFRINLGAIRTHPRLKALIPEKPDDRDTRHRQLRRQDFTSVMISWLNLHFSGIAQIRQNLIMVTDIPAFERTFEQVFAQRLRLQQ